MFHSINSLERQMPWQGIIVFRGQPRRFFGACNAPYLPANLGPGENFMRGGGLASEGLVS